LDLESFVINVTLSLLLSLSFLTLTFCYCRFRLCVVFVIVYTTLGSWVGASSLPLEVWGGDGDLVFIRGPCVVFLTGCAVFGSDHLVPAGFPGTSRRAALGLGIDRLRWILFSAGCALV